MFQADSEFTPLSVALCSVLTSALATISNEKNAGKFMNLEANSFAEMVSRYFFKIEIKNWKKYYFFSCQYCLLKESKIINKTISILKIKINNFPASSSPPNLLLAAKIRSTLIIWLTSPRRSSTSSCTSCRSMRIFGKFELINFFWLFVNLEITRHGMK